jgi:hypothetical protein
MMDLFLFALIVFVIGLIARYNESNKLFWTLLTPFVVAFAVTKMVTKDSSPKQDETVTLQVNPTQSAVLTSDAFMYLLAGDSVSGTKKATSPSVGKDTIPAAKDTIIPSKATVNTRDQPNKQSFFDTS